LRGDGSIPSAIPIWSEHDETRRMSGRVLVTGGAGFIGSHVAEAYLKEGWEVVVLDDLSRGHEKNVPKDARFVRADIRSPEARNLVATGKFDVLNHHAAQIDVRVSVDRPAFDAEINVVGLANLLDGAGEGGVRRVIFASSGGVVYGDPAVVPTPETAPKLPVSPYGVSKLSGEHYLRALGALRGFEGVAMRYANVFGPRQDPKSEAGVVSIFVSRLLDGQTLTVFGDGRQTRDYVFVKDVARANVLASSVTLPASNEFDAPAFNIATARETSVLELAQAVGKVMGKTPELEFAPPRPGELFRSSLDIGKATSVLGWTPTWSFDTGLPLLIDWFRTEAR
jgi:UDP-glucose 4-epimerase